MSSLYGFNRSAGLDKRSEIDRDGKPSSRSGARDALVTLAPEADASLEHELLRSGLRDKVTYLSPRNDFAIVVVRDAELEEAAKLCSETLLISRDAPGSFL